MLCADAVMDAVFNGQASTKPIPCWPTLKPQGGNMPEPYKFREFGIPERMRSGITLYINNGIRPGRFLTAVICNNLKEAVMYADDENIRNLPAYVNFFYNHTPGDCWGSEEKMQIWLQKAEFKGLLEKNNINSEFVRGITG